MKLRYVWVIIAIPVLISLPGYADSVAPDYYQSYIYFDSGSILQNWVTRCNTDPANDAHDGSGGYVCSQNVGSAANPNNLWCWEEGNIRTTWRVYHEQDGGTYGYANYGDIFLYNINWDADANDCNCRFGPGQYSIGGEFTQGNCCGDDANEYFTSVAGDYSGGSPTGCCNSDTDCIYDDDCVAVNTCYETWSAASPFSWEYCAAGNTWQAADDSSNACDCLAPGLWLIGGDVASNCCGDDLNEFYTVPLGDYSGGSTEGCCNSNNDCIYNDNCIAFGTCFETNSAASPNSQEYCSAGDTWQAADDSNNACNCLGLNHWLIGGEVATNCCGDDLGENDIDEQGDTDGVPSDACCTPATDCVDDSTCYGTNTCQEMGSPLSAQPGASEYCNNGQWQQDDTSQTACNCFMPGRWLVGGEIAACCGDDAGDNYLDEQGATDGANSDACCNAATDCVDDDACISDDTCRDTGSAASNLEYCDLGTWIDDDTLEEACIDCVGAGRWNIGFELGTTANCCGDDAADKYRDEQGDTDGANSVECCDTATDCVDDDTCYIMNTCQEMGSPLSAQAGAREFCSNTGQWQEDDTSQTACNCFMPGRWTVGGEIGACCGDDGGEFFISPAGDYATSVANPEACCNANNDCVDDNVCTSDGVCYETGSAGSQLGQEYCAAGTWQEDDASSNACNCFMPGRWSIGGEVSAASCCGDDAADKYRDEQGDTDGANSNACCDTATDCVDDDTCYDMNTCQEMGSPLSINGAEFCNNLGQWQQNDISETACNCYMPGMWSVGGEVGACCGDDGGEFFISPDGAFATSVANPEACCNANTDCVDDNVCTTDEDCYETGSAGSQLGLEYCDAGTWQEDDWSSDACDCSWPGRWSIGGEVSAASCCGDDAADKFRVEQGDTDGVNSDACCDTATDCVDDDTCYDMNSCQEIGSPLSAQLGAREYCNNTGQWQQNDRSETACDCYLPGMWSLGGNVAAGNCCGDDVNEYYLIPLGDVASTSPDTCCDDWNYCVDDDVCHADGVCHETGDAASLNEYCDGGFGGIWRDNDFDQVACDACVGLGRWSLGGDAAAASCCGDDVGIEFYRIPQGEAVSTSPDTCCNAITDCVDDDVCVDSGQCRDTLSAVSNDEYCDAGTWIDNDDSEIACTSCGGTWAADISRCCGDDIDIDTDDDCYRDVGLKVFDGTSTVRIAVERFISTPLRTAEGGTVYNIALVPVVHAKASQVRVQTAGGVVALRRLT